MRSSSGGPAPGEAPPAELRTPGRALRTVRVLLVLAGVMMAGYGVSGLVGDPAGPRTVGYPLFALAGVFGHDLVLAPVSLFIGVLLGRFAPAHLRGVLRGGLLVSGVLLVFGVPLALGFGHRASNPSALPLPYWHGLLITLAGVWLGTAVLVALRVLHRRR